MSGEEIPEERIIDFAYFKNFRKSMEFTSQTTSKSHLSAKDIKRKIDTGHVALLNARLAEIITKIHNAVDPAIQIDDLDMFLEMHITEVYRTLSQEDLISRMTNNGRPIEEVYFNWMRGYLISTYFTKALCEIFSTDPSQIRTTGQDDLTKPETFERAATADLEIETASGVKIRIEMQAGFQGTNDIKRHKVSEAKKIYRETQVGSLVIHFDIFNGQVAFVPLHTIDDEDTNWESRAQMEGQTVFSIDQDYFSWPLSDKPRKFEKLSIYQALTV